MGTKETSLAETDLVQTRRIFASRGPAGRSASRLVAISLRIPGFPDIRQQNSPAGQNLN